MANRKTGDLTPSYTTHTHTHTYITPSYTTQHIHHPIIHNTHTPHIHTRFSARVRRSIPNIGSCPVTRPERCRPNPWSHIEDAEKVSAHRRVVQRSNGRPKHWGPSLLFVGLCLSIGLTSSYAEQESHYDRWDSEITAGDLSPTGQTVTQVAGTDACRTSVDHIDHRNDGQPIRETTVVEIRRPYSAPTRSWQPWQYHHLQPMWYIKRPHRKRCRKKRDKLKQTPTPSLDTTSWPQDALVGWSRLGLIFMTRRAMMCNWDTDGSDTWVSGDVVTALLLLVTVRALYGNRLHQYGTCDIHISGSAVAW